MIHISRKLILSGRMAVLLLAALLLCSCSGKEDRERLKNDSPPVWEDGLTDGDREVERESAAGEENTIRSASGHPDAAGSGEAAGDWTPPEISGETASEKDKSEITEGGCYRETDRPQLQSGTLTAGEWNDNRNWEEFLELVQDQRVSFPLYGLNPVHRLTVHVTQNQRPVKNIPVALLDSQGEVLWEAVSDYEGCARVFYQTEGEGGNIDKPAFLRADLEPGKKDYAITRLKPGKKDYTIALSGDFRETPGTDVLFLFDTTGSMDDELAWLKKEFVSIANTFENRPMRFSANFYRDRGDDYVVESHPFSKDINEVSQVIDNAGADGGGDYEEAVDEALVDAVFLHDWDKNNVKLLFLVLDAPPHNYSEVRDSLRRTVKKAASLGIRIIPVSASGVNTEAEFLFRTLAIMTGGTYTFLTDDSGVGESHLEPTVGEYRTELLKDLVIRLIQLYNS